MKIISKPLQGSVKMETGLKAGGKAYVSYLWYGVGGLMIVTGLNVLLRAQQPDLRLFGAFIAIAGTLLLPATSRRLLKSRPSMAAWYVPPLMAAGALIIGLATVVVGKAVSGKGNLEPVAQVIPNNPKPRPELEQVAQRARAEIAAGADILALRVIVKGTNATERQSDPVIAGLLASIRSNLTKSYGSKDADKTIREELLPPTPKNLAKDEMLAQARATLRDGLPERALAIMFNNATSDMLQSDPETMALVAQIEGRMKEADALAGGESFADQVRTYWLPRVNGLATTSPRSAGEIWNSVAELENATRSLEDGSAVKLNSEAQMAQRDLRKAIADKQRALFPVLRKAYGKIVGQAMWENDLDIRVEGAANRTITWTGGQFAARTNIARQQERAHSHLQKLRFRTSTYEWARGIGNRYTYSMDAPADDAVGYWAEGAFKPAR